MVSGNGATGEQSDSRARTEVDSVHTLLNMKLSISYFLSQFVTLQTDVWRPLTSYGVHAPTSF